MILNHCCMSNWFSWTSSWLLLLLSHTFTAGQNKVGKQFFLVSVWITTFPQSLQAGAQAGCCLTSAKSGLNSQPLCS